MSDLTVDIQITTESRHNPHTGPWHNARQVEGLFTITYGNTSTRSGKKTRASQYIRPIRSVPWREDVYKDRKTENTLIKTWWTWFVSVTKPERLHIRCWVPVTLILIPSWMVKGNQNMKSMHQWKTSKHWRKSWVWPDGDKNRVVQSDVISPIKSEPKMFLHWGLWLPHCRLGEHKYVLDLCNPNLQSTKTNRYVVWKNVWKNWKLPKKTISPIHVSFICHSFYLLFR